MDLETGVQSQVELYQRFKKWYLIPPCLALGTLRWGSRLKWSNPGNGVAPSLTPLSGSYWKGNLRVTFGSPSTKVANFTYLQIFAKWVLWWTVMGRSHLTSQLVGQLAGGESSINGYIFTGRLYSILFTTLWRYFSSFQSFIMIAFSIKWI